LFDFKNIKGASLVSGAIIGAGSGFTSGLVVSGGNLNAAFQGGLQGLVGGAIVGGVNGFASSIPGASNPNVKFAAETLYNGVKNKIENRKFFDGADISLLSFGASKLYSNLVGYDSTYERGGPAVEKGEYSRPVKGFNLIYL